MPSWNYDGEWHAAQLPMLLGVDETTVQLKNTRGDAFKLPFEKLSNGDHRFLKIINSKKAAAQESATP